MSTTITSPPYSRRSGYFRKRSIRTGLLDWTKKKQKKQKKNLGMLSRDLFYKFQSFPKLPSCYKFKIILRLSATKICQIFNCFVCV